MKLRHYQMSIHNQIVAKQSDCVFQLDTGAGKTAIIAKLNTMPTINIAHRNFLVEQISNTLTLNKVPHKIIACQNIVKRCKLFQRNHGLHDELCEQSNVYVGTVQSITSRNRYNRLNIDKSLNYQIIIDECHHVASGNMWANLKDIFPNARFIGATATPCRLDGQGLHKKCGGLFDELIQADELRENSVLSLIGMGYLADYEAYSRISFQNLPMPKSIKWDFTKSELEKWANGRISLNVIGDVIKQYQKLANDKTAIVFAPSIDVADQISQVFQKHGYVATYIASSLSLVENMRRIDAFKRGEVKILCNVEMATEGFDLPSAECLIILRPTVSLVLHRQMIGRVMRPKPNGQKAVILDHVGNVIKHGLPDDKIEWTLHGTPKNHSERVAPCEVCDYVYNAYLKNCPNCGPVTWLRSDTFEGSRAVEFGYFDVDLAKKIRREIHQRELEAQKRIEREQHEQRLKTEIMVSGSFHRYDNSAIGNLCEKLSYWFLENIKQSDIQIAEINRFMQKADFRQFWIDNFTIKDLKTNDSKKCERVLKKWLKSH